MNITRILNNVQTIPQLLETYRESEALAVICGDEAVSYRQLISDARKIASGIRSRGSYYLFIGVQTGEQDVHSDKGKEYTHDTHQRVDRHAFPLPLPLQA